MEREKLFDVLAENISSCNCKGLEKLSRINNIREKLNVECDYRWKVSEEDQQDYELAEEYDGSVSQLKEIYLDFKKEVSRLLKNNTVNVFVYMKENGSYKRHDVPESDFEKILDSDIVKSINCYDCDSLLDVLEQLYL